MIAAPLIVGGVSSMPVAGSESVPQPVAFCAWTAML